MQASNNILLFMIVLLFSVLLQSNIIDACQSDIYCRGELLEAVQMAEVYKDSKTFVDMKMRYDADTTMEMFRRMMDESEDFNKTNIKEFVDEAFEPAGMEFVPWKPEDWIESPKFLSKIDDQRLKEWAGDLHGMWRDLGRKMNSSIKHDSELYSIIYVDKPVIIPGGRFREFYYWDSYWIVQGLLISEMYDTVRGMLENFMGLVNQFGFVPNGGRIYYTERSQPPLLTPMVKSYYDATKDVKFLENYTHVLEKELQFWLHNRTIVVNTGKRNFTVGVYKQNSHGPRPESYREDVRIAQHFQNDTERDEFYKQIKSAAESGWDFSSRWFVTANQSNEGNLTNLKTSTIVPVDLNAILQWNARLVAEFYGIIGNRSKYEEYAKIAEEFRQVLYDLLWNNEFGVWLDYDAQNNKPRPYFYPSNLAPLWTQSNNLPEYNGKIETAEDDATYASRVKRVLLYLKHPDVSIDSYPGGVPSTLVSSGEQWDFPNAWAPLQHMVILGLNSTRNEDAQDLSFDLCQKWVLSNYKAYDETKHMYEKYNASRAGAPGNGGEYEVQLGFGWTNGVVLDLLDRYGGRLTIDQDPERSGNSASDYANDVKD